MGVFTQVGVTYDALGNYVFYIGGVPSGSGTNLVSFAFAGTGAIGYDPLASTDYFQGLIDMLYIYNRVLTVGEMAGLNNGGNGIQYPNIPTIWTNETY